MQISKYQPLQAPKYIKQIMEELMLEQRFRYLKIQKPLPTPNTFLSKPQQTYVPFQKQIKPIISGHLKTKTIKKLKDQQIDIKLQKKAQRLLNLNLLHRLNISSIEAANQGISPPLSVLDTKEQGQYLNDGQKKQYPHFSNVLKPTQIVNENQGKYIPKLIKKPKQYFTSEQNCVFKIKQVCRFPKILFKYGNQQFSKIAEELNSSQCNIKLLYDVFNDYFDVEERIEIRSDDQKRKIVKNMRKFLIRSFQNLKDRDNVSSVYIPKEEQFVNLQQIRNCLNIQNQRQEQMEEDEN